MGLLDKLLNKKNPFENLNVDELTKEAIRLEREEQLKIADIEKLDKKKKHLFEEGFTASDAQRQSLATKIKTADRDLKLQNKNLQTINKQIIVINNLKFIKEQEKLLKSEGIMAKISKISPSELDKHLSDINLEQKFATQGIDAFNEIIDNEFGLQGDTAQDPETKELMDLWKSGSEVEADEVYESWEKKRKSSKDEESEYN